LSFLSFFWLLLPLPMVEFPSLGGWRDRPIRPTARRHRLLRA
jgi:hypothetical protein